MQPDLLTDTAEFVPSTEASTQTPGPTSPTVQVDVAGRSHPGKVRANNEDNYLVVRFGRFLQTVLTSLPDGELPAEYADTGYGIAVADGMGGMAAGEVASRLAITLLINLVLETPDWIFSHDEPYADELAARAVRRFYQLNQSIIEQTRREPWLRGMGTTLTMACSLGANVLIVHVGDSPVYLSRGRGFYRLTRDHTVAQQMADDGSIPIEAVPSRYRHILTHALGIRESGTEPDVRHVQLRDGDRLLLCTDGLTDMVDDAAIAAELRQRASSDEACQALLDLALERGGKDNITVVVASYQIEAGA